MKDSTQKVLEAVLLISTALAGFLLNVLVLLVFYKRPALRSPSNRFVLSLILANLVSLLGLVPVVLVNLISRNLVEWHQVTSVNTFAVTTSVFSILAIAIDRYNAVLSPLHYTMTITSQRSRGMIALVWCISILLSLPPVSGLISRRRFATTPEHEILILSYAIILSTIGFTIPLFALVWVYARMYTAAHRNSVRTRRQSLQANTVDIGRTGSLVAQYPTVIQTSEIIRSGKPPMLAQIKKRRCSNASLSGILFREEGRAMKTAAMVVTTFILCWGPFFFELLSDTLSKEIVPEATRFFAVLLAILNSVFSPFIYVFRNEIARQEAVRLLLWWRKVGLYEDNVLHHASREVQSKGADGTMRIRHQSSSNYDSMSVQSFQLPVNYNNECKQCGVVTQQPVADFVATYEVAETPQDTAKSVVAESVDETKPKTRGESVTFRLAFLSQRRCHTCVRQNSDSSTSSGYPLLRESESPTPSISLVGKRQEILSRANSTEDSPTFRVKVCDSPKYLITRCDRDEAIPEQEEQLTPVTNTNLKEYEKGSTWITNEDVRETQKIESARQDSDATVDSGVDVGMDRSHSSSSSLSAISPVVSRPKRHRHKLQRLAAVEDEDSLNKSKPSVQPSSLSTNNKNNIFNNESWKVQKSLCGSCSNHNRWSVKNACDHIK